MAKKYFVSRHSGAHLWASQRIPYDERCESLDPTTLQQGDIVFGTLPVSLAAEAIKQGAHYVHLTLDLPESMRGRELDSEQMESYQARLEEFHIERRPGMHDAIIKEADPATNAAAPLVMVVIHSAETLANLVPILHFKPTIVVIFHTDEYKDNRKWLISAIKHNNPTATIVEKKIEISYFENISIMDKTLKRWPDARLVANVTGGMKSMSLALTEVSRRHGSDVVYFDVRTNRIDHVYPEKPGESLLNDNYAVDLWLRAHGHDTVKFASQENDLPDKIRKARELANVLLKIEALEIACLYSLISLMDKRLSMEIGTQYNLHPELLSLLKQHGVLITSQGVNTLTFSNDVERTYYGGSWFEYFVFDAIREAGFSNAEMGAKLFALDKSLENELDVVAVVNNRPLVVEVKSANLNHNPNGGKNEKIADWINKLSAVATRAGGAMSMKIIVSLFSIPVVRHGAILDKTGIRVIHGNGFLDQGLLKKALLLSINGKRVVEPNDIIAP